MQFPTVLSPYASYEDLCSCSFQPWSNWFVISNGLLTGQSTELNRKISMYSDKVGAKKIHKDNLLHAIEKYIFVLQVIRDQSPFFRKMISFWKIQMAGAESEMSRELEKLITSYDCIENCLNWISCEWMKISQSCVSHKYLTLHEQINAKMSFQSTALCIISCQWRYNQSCVNETQCHRILMTADSMSIMNT